MSQTTATSEGNGVEPLATVEQHICTERGVSANWRLGSCKISRLAFPLNLFQTFSTHIRGGSLEVILTDPGKWIYIVVTYFMYDLFTTGQFKNN
jgi:hypothetical protein